MVLTSARMLARPSACSLNLRRAFTSLRKPDNAVHGDKKAEIGLIPFSFMARRNVGAIGSSESFRLRDISDVPFTFLYFLPYRLDPFERQVNGRTLDNVNSRDPLGYDSTNAQ